MKTFAFLLLGLTSCVVVPDKSPPPATPQPASTAPASSTTPAPSAPALQPSSGERDGDGLADPVDQCPDDPEDLDGFTDEDGCPDPDNDTDGVLDVDDLCPNDPEDRDGKQDEDGCPEK